MKYYISNIKVGFLLFILIIINNSCHDEEIDEKGVEIYTSKYRCDYDPYYNYSTLYLDAIELSNEPFLTMDQIESYDTVNHIINLYDSKLELTYPDLQTLLHGQLFIICVNNVRVYCGFFWTTLSSMPCRWVVIERPPEEAGVTDFQIKIRKGYAWLGELLPPVDPRNDPRIINAFTRSGKIASGK